MKKFLFAFTVLSSVLVAAPNAHAQMAVIDAANLAQNLQTAAQSIAAVEQLRAQLSQLENTYTMFTNPTNILGMATGMENSAVENPMPLTNSLTGLVGGQTSGGSAATTYYNQNHIYTAPAGTPNSTQLNQNAVGIANIEGIASTNLSAIQERLQELPNLEADLNSATSITQVSAINGRIATESQFVQAQQAQAANLQVLASEQQASQQQQEREQFNQDQTNLATELQADAAVSGGQ
jgi:type IV secretion system protein VirB5